MANLLKRLKVREVSLVKRPANPGAKVLLFKGDDMTEGVRKFADSIKGLLRAVATGETADGKVLKSEDEVTAFVDEQVEAMVASMAVTSPNTETEEEDDSMSKEQVEELTALTKAAQDEAAAVRAELAATKADLKKMQDDQRAEEVRKQAEKMVGQLPGKVDEMAALLSELSPEGVARLDALLAPARELAASSLTKELGSGGRPSGGQLAVIAKKIEAEEKVTAAKAMALAAERNPALYEAEYGTQH